MNLVKLYCAFCSKKFFRPVGRVNEAKKYGWKQFCSLRCLANSKITGVKLSCSNPQCKKEFYRQRREIKKAKRSFCSQSCAAIVNNLLKRKIKICPICKKQFYGEQKYCSNLCRSRVVNAKKKSESQRQKEVLNDIKDFYNTQNRIPTKKEKPGLAWRAQLTFGSWNKAIETAGFDSNPVIFSKKFVAQDGHKCDSFAEKIIDDWFYEKRIKHKKNVPYPENKLLSADFLVGNNFIEYFGLKGVISKYDRSIVEKRKLCKKYKLALIEIYPKDLFPVNRLARIINIDHNSRYSTHYEV